MKNFKYILAVVAIIIIGYLAQKNWQAGTAVVNEETPAAPVLEICYVWNTEAGDNASLKLATDDGVAVTGIFNYVPAEKDSKKGTLKGSVGDVDETTMTQVADLIWTASGEGMTNAEALKVVLGEGTAKPGFGEMKLNITSGVYEYADIGKISYDLTLQQTECSDPALKF
jgi:hypothetical protein